MFLKFNLFTMLWALVIFFLILLPGRQMPETGDLLSFDKLAHLGVFCILTFLMIIGFSKQYTFAFLKKNPIKSGMLVSSLYASALELGQSIIPDRYANVYDMAFNLSGVAVGWILFLIVYKFSFV